MDPHPPAVAQLHGGLQLLGAEVAGKGAHAEQIARQIHRVRSVGQGHLEPLHIPGGGEQFNLLSHICFSPKEWGRGQFPRPMCFVYPL